MKFFNKNFLQALVIGIILILVYKSADSINYIVKWIGGFIGVISPIIIGAIIAFFIYRPVCRIEEIYKRSKLKFVAQKSRILGLVSVYAIILVAVVVIVNYIGPVFAKNIKELFNNIPKYTYQFEELLKENNIVVADDILLEIEKKIFEFFDIARITKYISVVSSIANSFLSFFVGVILSAYMILERENIFAFMKKIKNRFFNTKTTKVLIYYAKKSVNLFYSYFSGLAFDAALIGIITSIVLSLFNVPYSVLLGVIVAVGNLIPFFGAIVSNIVVYVIVSFSFGPLKALWILAFQFALGQIDGNLIQPKIVGDSVGISPFLVFVSVTVFGGLFGPVGMLIGAPLIAVLRMVINDYLDNRRPGEEKN